MGHDSKLHTRRNFLSMMGVTTTLPLFQSPLQVLIESIVMGAAQRTFAADAGLNPRRYLHILFQGAPPRWVFDLFLTPYDNNYVANPTLGMKYTGGSTATGVGYSTVVKRNINVPYLWSFNVPKAGGGTRPLDPLLDNMIMMRGIYVGNPDHGAAQELQSLPLGAGQSMSALAGDAAIAPLSAVNAGIQQFKYRSTKSKTAVGVSGYGNMLTSLLDPFVRSPAGGFSLKSADMGAALDASIAALNASAEAIHPDVAGIAKSTDAAKQLLSQGFGNLTTTWNGLLGKYQDLVSRSFDKTQSLPGINDKPIMVGGADFRNSTPATSKPTKNGFLAAHFAMAEYLLCNNLSYSVSIGPDAPNVSGYFFDEHGTSALESLILNSYYNLAYGACMLELIDRLKAKGIYNDTVIVSGGEFGRTPRLDMAGSDHAYTGGSCAIHSGIVTGPMILGNIYRDQKQDASDGGTWGKAAPISQLGKVADLGHWASTVATLLRVPSPVTASNSLISEQAGKIVSLIEKSKQV